jgi:hypothetical protein
MPIGHCDHEHRIGDHSGWLMDGSEEDPGAWRGETRSAVPSQLVLSGVYVPILQFTLDSLVTVC